jgi:hypothetical protein
VVGRGDTVALAVSVECRAVEGVEPVSAVNCEMGRDNELSVDL